MIISAEVLFWFEVLGSAIDMAAAASVFLPVDCYDGWKKCAAVPVCCID